MHPHKTAHGPQGDLDDRKKILAADTRREEELEMQREAGPRVYKSYTSDLNRRRLVIEAGHALRRATWTTARRSWRRTSGKEKELEMQREADDLAMEARKLATMGWTVEEIAAELKRINVRPPCSAPSCIYETGAACVAWVRERWPGCWNRGEDGIHSREGPRNGRSRAGAIQPGVCDQTGGRRARQGARRVAGAAVQVQYRGAPGFICLLAY